MTRTFLVCCFDADCARGNSARVRSTAILLNHYLSIVVARLLTPQSVNVSEQERERERGIPRSSILKVDASESCLC